MSVPVCGAEDQAAVVVHHGVERPGAGGLAPRSSTANRLAPELVTAPLAADREPPTLSPEPVITTMLAW